MIKSNLPRTHQISLKRRMFQVSWLQWDFLMKTGFASPEIILESIIGLISQMQLKQFIGCDKFCILTETSQGLILLCYKCQIVNCLCLVSSWFIYPNGLSHK